MSSIPDCHINCHVDLFSKKIPQYINRLAKMTSRQVGIPHCHGNVRMPQKLPNTGNVNPVHDKLTSEGMAEVMKMEIFNIGLLAGSNKGTLNPCKRFAGDNIKEDVRNI